MIGIITKKADRIDKSDIEALIQQSVPEGDQLEYKRDLSSKQDSSSWKRGGDTIEDSAKIKILEEVVAFANSTGGALVLGIEESGEEQGTAHAISPLPHIEELEKRFKLIFRDCVDPKLPHIEIISVRTEEEAGVVIFRVDRSHLAPHRVTKSLVCPIRRADRREEMTMREIQDLTLNISLGTKGLEKRFRQHNKTFNANFDRLGAEPSIFGVRFTALPLFDEIYFARILQQSSHLLISDFEVPWGRLYLSRDGQKFDPLEVQVQPPTNWLPRLRAARATDRITTHNQPLIKEVYREIRKDGGVEYGYMCASQNNDGKVYISEYLLAELFANLLLQLNQVRVKGNRPNAEYAIEVEFYMNGDGETLVRVDQRLNWSETFRTIASGKFPKYSLNDSEDINSLLNVFYQDFWDSLNIDSGHEILCVG